MGDWLLRFLFLFLNFCFIYACGIKRDPKPLPLPEFSLRRIGTYVYLIPKGKGVHAEGFFGERDFMFRLEKRNFCFRVWREKGRERNVCVEGAYTYRPKAELLLEKDRLIVRLSRSDRYRIYPYTDRLIPKPIEEFVGSEVSLPREYSSKRYAITEVKGSVESEPLIVEVPAKIPPKPPKPEGVSYVKRGEKIYIYWFMQKDVKGYIVYRNGKLLTPEPILRNVFIDKEPEELTRYEIVSVNEFGVRSDPAVLIYKP